MERYSLPHQKIVDITTGYKKFETMHNICQFKSPKARRDMKKSSIV